jgi:hypothetical protein
MSNQPKGMLDKVPYGLTEEQLVAAIAWAWLVKPDMMYQGLKQAFSLAPKPNELVN